MWCYDVKCSVAEVFDLFDDVLLLAEGHIVFHGPKDQVRLHSALGA
jgi:ABC-type multidrug transport system ATPase subunit